MVAFFAVIAAAASARGNALVAKRAVIAGFTAAAVISTGVAVEAGLIAGESGAALRDALPPAAVAATTTLLGVGVAVREAALGYLCFICSMLLAFATAYYYSFLPIPVQMASVYSSRLGSSIFVVLLVHIGLVESAALLAASVAAFLTWLRQKRSKEAAAIKETRLSAAILSELVARDSDSNSLLKIQQLLLNIQSVLPPKASVAQTASALALARSGENSSNETGATGPDATTGTVVEVSCLDTILLQAQATVVLLQQKAKEWALLSHGCFPVAAGFDKDKNLKNNFSASGNINGPAVISCARITRDPGLANSVFWAPVTTRRQALVALGRSAANSCARSFHVAGLLDCAKVDIYYKDLGGIAALLEALRIDTQVQIVACQDRLGLPLKLGPNLRQGMQISKNVLGKSAFSGNTDGAWCVALNIKVRVLDHVFEISCQMMIILLLQINSEESRRLGLEQHVCELLVYLAPRAT